MIARFCLAVMTLFVAVSCATRDEAGQEGAAATTVQDRNACHLLTHEEVATLVGRPITLSDQTEAGDTWSTCDWEDASGTFAFGLTAYWSGGKQQWDTWRMAQGLGERVLKAVEGVSVDSVVQQGLVDGIGDGAYFSGLLPSLVLKGDVLFEMKLVVVPEAGAKFAGLARRLISKIG